MLKVTLTGHERGNFRTMNIDATEWGGGDRHRTLIDFYRYRPYTDEELKEDPYLGRGPRLNKRIHVASIQKNLVRTIEQV